MKRLGNTFSIFWGPWQLTAYLIAATILFAAAVDANPYVEYKNSTKFTHISDSMKTTEYLRVGYKFEKNYYVEFGKDSGEAGYKFKLNDNLVVKGKIETTGNFSKHGLETEVRYTF